MGIFIVFGLLVVVGIVLTYIQVETGVDVELAQIAVWLSAIAIGGASLIAFIGLHLGYLGIPAEYNAEIEYIESFDGVALSPQERDSVVNTILDINKTISVHRLLATNFWVGWFYSTAIAALPRVEYDLQESVISIRVME